MDALLLTSIAAASTSVGGYSTLVLRRRIHVLMALGAGVLLGAACLDLIPAALSSAAMRGWPRTPVFAFAVVGGIFFYSLERAKAWRLRDGERTAGRIAASFLIIHSALDGCAIFAAAAVSVKMGLAVGLGIVAHDASDGLNTVLLSSAGRSPSWQDYAFLGLDALAPIAGGLMAGHLFKVSPTLVVVFLSFAGGAFLYTAVFGLMPDAYRRYGRLRVYWASVAGFLLIWCLTGALGRLA